MSVAASPIPSGSIPTSRRGRIAWYLYDWGNSAFPTVVLTFVFATYFTQGVVGDPVRGTTAWGNAMALAALIIAIASPLLGAVVDASGRVKPWLALLTVVTALCTAALWFVRPDPAYIPLALVLVALGTIAFELGMTLYNALLPRVSPPDRIGRTSGIGWGVGYAGGLVCLVAILYGLVLADPAPFGLDKAAAEPVRAAFVAAGLWFFAFTWPILRFAPPDRGADRPGGMPLRHSLRAVWRNLADLWREVRGHPRVLWFLVANTLYIDALNTVFGFGGIYAAGQFGMTTEEVLQFGIALNVTAGLGAVGFALIEDRVGARRVLIVSLLAILALGAGLLLVDRKDQFWALGLALGAFFGPVQSASRTYIATVAPPEMTARLYGLLTLAGRATSFLGPVMVATATALADSQRAGMASILLLFALALPILIFGTGRLPSKTRA